MNSLIITALKPTNVPVSFQTYSGSASTYITFFEVTQNPAVNADDTEIQTRFIYQIDVWSKSDYTNLTKQVKELLIAQGFRRSVEGPEDYEPDIQLFHKPIRFIYIK